MLPGVMSKQDFARYLKSDFVIHRAGHRFSFSSPGFKGCVTLEVMGF